MKIEQLRPNLGILPAAKAFPLFLAYYEQRTKDLELLTVIIEKPRRKTKAKKKKKKDEVVVSPSDLEILKKLGLV